MKSLVRSLHALLRCDDGYVNFILKADFYFSTNSWPRCIISSNATNSLRSKQKCAPCQLQFYAPFKSSHVYSVPDTNCVVCTEVQTQRTRYKKKTEQNIWNSDLEKSAFTSNNQLTTEGIATPTFLFAYQFSAETKDTGNATVQLYSDWTFFCTPTLPVPNVSLVINMT